MDPTYGSQKVENLTVWKKDHEETNSPKVSELQYLRHIQSRAVTARAERARRATRSRAARARVEFTCALRGNRAMCACSARALDFLARCALRALRARTLDFLARSARKYSGIFENHLVTKSP